MTRTALQEKTTATSTGVGSISSIDISGINSDWTLVLEVFGMDAVDSVEFTFEDSVDGFTTPVAGPTVNISGQVSGGGASTLTFPSAKRYSFTKKDYPGLRFGTGSAVLRLKITRLTGSSPHVTFQSWLES